MRGFARFALIVLLVVVGCAGLYGQADPGVDDAAALRESWPELNREIDSIRAGTWLHAGSAVGGFLLFPTFPVLLPIGTTVGALNAVSSAEEYREEIEFALGYDPLPSLDRARNLTIAAAASYLLGEVALLYMIVAAFGGFGHDSPAYELHTNISGGIFAGSFLFGLGATTYATWNARNTTLEFHDSIR